MRRIFPAFLGLLLAACGAAPSGQPQPSPQGGSSVDTVASLTIEPRIVTLGAGETADVRVVLDLRGRTSQSFQMELTYDPAVIEVLDADPTTRGVQVQLGMYETAIENVVESGRIHLVGYSLTPGTEAQGNGALASFTIRGVSVGATELAVDWEQGMAASKTKVILMGETDDVLGGADSATVTVQ